MAFEKIKISACRVLWHLLIRFEHLKREIVDLDEIYKLKWVPQPKNSIKKITNENTTKLYEILKKSDSLSSTQNLAQRSAQLLGGLSQMPVDNLSQKPAPMIRILGIRH